MSDEKNRMDGLKEAYDSIPVPEGLSFRVQASIVQAREAQKKEENRMHSMNTKKTHHYFRNTAASVAAAMLAIVVLANSSATVAHAMEGVPVLGTIVKVVTFRTYEDRQGNNVINVEVPQVEGGGDALNADIQAYTDDIIAQYHADVEAAGGEGSMEVDLTYETVTDNEALFALRFDQTILMASGAEFVKIYNVDKASGRILKLTQLFRDGDAALNAISDSVKQQMRDQMADDESIAYWLDDPEVPESNFQSVTADSTFYVNQDGQLVVVFDEGGVAPMYMGVVEFVIPGDALAGLALPGYLK